MNLWIVSETRTHGHSLRMNSYVPRQNSWNANTLIYTLNRVQWPLPMNRMNVMVMIRRCITLFCVSLNSDLRHYIYLDVRIWGYDTANDTKPLEKFSQRILLPCLHLSPIRRSPAPHVAHCFHNRVSGTLSKEETAKVASDLVWSFGVSEAQQWTQSLSLPLLSCCLHSQPCCWRDLSCAPYKTLGA